MNEENYKIEILKENFPQKSGSHNDKKEIKFQNKSSLSSQGKNIGQFILGKKIGEGTFGIVTLATHILTGEKVAIKILDKKKILEHSDKTRLEREIKILKVLHHNNIVHLYSVIQSSNSIYLIMEYISGKELFEYIILNKRLNENEACKFYQQIISGLEYLYKLRIAHRDLKPENLLLDSKKNIKIVDFGLSNMFPHNELLSTPCGSPSYASPEMISGKKYNGSLSDIWSSGIILFAMLCGYLPFENTNNEILYKKITEGVFNIPNYISEEGKDLLRKILNVNPDKRYNFKQIKNHPWFNLIDYKINFCKGLLINRIVIPIDEDLINKMSEYDYDKNETRKNILSNKHNHITTTYYLMLKKKIKKGIDSVADLKSKLFENYINNPENKLSKYGNDIEKVIKERGKGKVSNNEELKKNLFKENESFGEDIQITKYEYNTQKNNNNDTNEQISISNNNYNENENIINEINKHENIINENKNENIINKNNIHENIINENNINNNNIHENIINESKNDENILNENKKDENILNENKKDENIINENKKDGNIINESKNDENILNESKNDENILNESKNDEKILNESKNDEKIINENNNQEKKYHINKSYNIEKDENTFQINENFDNKINLKINKCKSNINENIKLKEVENINFENQISQKEKKIYSNNVIKKIPNFTKNVYQNKNIIKIPHSDKRETNQKSIINKNIRKHKHSSSLHNFDDISKILNKLPLPGNVDKNNHNKLLVTDDSNIPKRNMSIENKISTEPNQIYKFKFLPNHKNCEKKNNNNNKHKTKNNLIPKWNSNIKTDENKTASNYNKRKMYSLSVYSNRNEKKNVNLSHKKIQKYESKIIEKERIEDKINNLIKNKENKENKKNKKFLNTSTSFDKTLEDDKNKSIDHHSDNETSADKKEKDLKYIKMKSINKKFNVSKEEQQKEIINNLKPINIIKGNKISYQNYILNSSKVKKNEEINDNKIELNDIKTHFITNHHNLNNKNILIEPFDLLSLIYSSLSKIKSCLEKELKNLKIQFYVKKNKYVCKKGDIKFEINIIKINELNNYFIIKYIRKDETFGPYKDIIKYLANKLNSFNIN